jgi:hypothetical protein
MKGLSMHDYLSVVNDEKMGSYGHPCPKPLMDKTYCEIIAGRMAQGVLCL